MYAIIDDGDNNRWDTVEDPVPRPGEVTVRVHATAVNRADLVQRAGLYPPPPGITDILGLEVAGRVETSAHGWAAGERVMALLAGGGYAERVSVPAGHLMAIPASWSFEMAAAVPEVFATAWLNLALEAGVTEGDKVLLHAGASGVGTAAIQVCRVLGAHCFVTAGSDEKIARCVALGAEGGFQRHAGSFRDAVSAWAPGGVDVILDPVGGRYLDDNLRVLGVGGRLVVIGLLGGSKGELSVARLLMKRLRIIGSTLRSRSVTEKTEILTSMEASLSPFWERGELHPVVDRVFPIEQVDEAFRLLRGNGTFGKLVLKVR